MDHTMRKMNAIQSYVPAFQEAFIELRIHLFKSRRMGRLLLFIRWGQFVYYVWELETNAVAKASFSKA